jgi:NifU-like protein
MRTMPTVPDNPIVCRCYRVTQGEILDAIRDSDLRTVEEVTARTNAAGGCSSCYDDVQAILNQVHGATPTVSRTKSLPDARKKELVLETVRDFIGPFFAINGVQIQILEVRGPKIMALLAGRIVGTTQPSILALKWAFVQAVSDACGERMQLVEVNMQDLL